MFLWISKTAFTITFSNLAKKCITTQPPLTMANAHVHYVLALVNNVQCPRQMSASTHPHHIVAILYNGPAQVLFQKCAFQSESGPHLNT